MRAVVQRVTKAEVSVSGSSVSKIEAGLLALICVESGDTEKDVDYMSEKILNLRIFSDEKDIPNLSLLDIKGELLAVSQFTLAGDVRKGRRPSYSNAENPEKAEKLFNRFCEISNRFIPVRTGIFRTDMQVSLVNDGPFTILISSRKEF